MFCIFYGGLKMMKNCKLLFSISLSLVFIFAMTFMVYGEESIQGVIIGSDVNIRKMPDVKSDVVDQLTLGAVAEVLSHEGNWYSIRTTLGTEGWILNDLIAVDADKDPIKLGVVSVNTLNVRKDPSTSSDILYTLSKGAEVPILTTQDMWYQVPIDESQKGWIHSDYVELKPNYSKGKIIGSNVNVRRENSINSEVVSQLRLESYIYIKNYSNEWYNILTYDGQEGWVHKDFVSIVINDYTDKTVSRSSNRISLKIISEAKKLLGIPYKYGSAGPNSFDCSGFTSYVFKRAGVELPRTSKTQAKVGTKVSKSNLQVGDLVFFDTSGSYNGVISHVGIFIGNGEFIHASSGKNARKVVITKLNNGYYDTKFVTARRVY